MKMDGDVLNFQGADQVWQRHLALSHTWSAGNLLGLVRAQRAAHERLIMIGIKRLKNNIYEFSISEILLIFIIVFLSETILSDLPGRELILSRGSSIKTMNPIERERPRSVPESEQGGAPIKRYRKTEYSITEDAWFRDETSGELPIGGERPPTGKDKALYVVSSPHNPQYSITLMKFKKPELPVKDLHQAYIEVKVALCGNDDNGNEILMYVSPVRQDWSEDELLSYTSVDIDSRKITKISLPNNTRESRIKIDISDIMDEIDENGVALQVEYYPARTTTCILYSRESADPGRMIVETLGDPILFLPWVWK